MTLPSIDSRLQRVLTRQAKAADTARWDRHQIDDELAAFNDLVVPRVELTGWHVPPPNAHEIAATAVAADLAAALTIT